MSPRARRVLFMALFVLVFGWFVFWLLRGVGGPFLRGHDGFNGAAFTQAAKNSLRFDVSAQFQYHFELDQPDEQLAYTHHPMMLHWHLQAMFHAFGVSELAGRLVPALYSLGIFLLLFFGVRRFLGSWTALAACAIWALTPLHLVFAHMVNHEQGSIFWLLAFVLATCVGARRDDGDTSCGGWSPLASPHSSTGLPTTSLFLCFPTPSSPDFGPRRSDSGDPS